MGMAWGTVGISWGTVGISWGTVSIAWGIGGHGMGHQWAWHGASNQTSFYPFVPHEISVLVELILGHLRYLLTDVPPQPNSPPDNVFHPIGPPRQALGPKRGSAPLPIHGISKITLKVVVFHFRRFRLPLILHLSSHFTKSD
ncbi:hypothetical protein FEM48_ZijujUnG0056500 [Ziziphus jujuba var. spinosa]|uniref:Regulator of rDNA transcription protein 15 n=1 Tax=Ziziphus jujuba var. spinosa TaxID=714518 RepID=A0A978U927_ZIZJJ|nr:hypothetical protein FEM48_ZijujUnG0056500 [Ziziphus jujuba var. spinosa]